MYSPIDVLRTFFARDIIAAAQEIESTPDTVLWSAPPGVTNSAGVFAQHLVGNLNHFVGHGLGNTGYTRTREREFTNTGRTSAELAAELRDTGVMVERVLAALAPEQLEQPFPIETPAALKAYSTGEFLQHLYHHLSYHLGQLNYVRRISMGLAAQ